MKFQELFSGSDKSHGHWEPDKGHQTEHGPVHDGDYEAHLAGTRGLGIVPVRPDGTCRFGAVDIDIDTIDHQFLREKVDKRKLPLNVCRSKSGGAHLYLFYRDPQKANRVQQVLKKWAGLLGYPKAEIFPKQLVINKKNLGNWINLPYFGGDSTTRYCVGEKGALSLAEFEEQVKFYEDYLKDVDETFDKDLVQIGQMPPCLASLSVDGVPEGGRNQALFNFGVFARKSNPNGWEDLVVQYNVQLMRPPMSNREVQSVIKSIAHKTYQYTCNMEPICSRCDKQACLQLPFGVGHMPWQEPGMFDECLVSRLRKIETDPPRYLIEAAGHDIELGTAELLEHGRFRKRVFELLDLVIPPMKAQSWEKVIKDLVSQLETIEAPRDASPKGMVLDKVNEFLSLFERARKKEDLLKGIPVEDGDRVLFRVQDLQRYLQNQKFQQLENQVLYQLLRGQGCDHKSYRLKGRVVTVWSMPVKSLNLQTEDFDQPKFQDLSKDM